MKGLLTGARAGDVASGAIFIAFGVTFAAGSLQYDLGSLLEPGPGLFPLGVALVLVLLGALIVSKPVVARLAERRAGSASADAVSNDASASGIDDGEPGPTLTVSRVWDTARPFVLILGAIFFFAFAIEPLGFVVTTFVTSTLAALGWKGGSGARVLITATVLTVVSYVIFVILLRLRVDLLPFGW
jgi:hypothetical protein